ncbi:MAG: hexitol phosphatase HxpB [Chloroflexota bacterium]
MAVFETVGVHLTEQQCLETMGVRIAEIVEMWFSRHPWVGPTVEEVTRRIEDYVVDRVLSSGKPNAGVREALELVRHAGLSIAIASSSSERLIRAVVQSLDIGEYIQVICSGDNEAVGKPDPAVYLSTARRLGVPPGSCVALEDSPNGVLAAKAAGMYCIVVPDRHLETDPIMRRADLRLESLEDLSKQVLTMIDRIPAS